MKTKIIVLRKKMGIENERTKRKKIGKRKEYVPHTGVKARIRKKELVRIFAQVLSVYNTVLCARSSRI